MAKRKVPSQAASGFDTFSDSLVGRQITDGTSQLTNTNFALDRVIPEKDSKKFQTAPFSDFITLENLKIEQDVPTTVVQSDGKKRPVRFNQDKTDASKSLFGSLKERLRVSISRIIKNYPGAIFVDATGLASVNNNTAEDISYDPTTNRTTFTSQVGKFFNPFDIVLTEPVASNLIPVDNPIRNFYSSYTKYIAIIDGEKYQVKGYTQPNQYNVISLVVEGQPFTGTTYSNSFILRPNDGVVEEFYLGLDDLEQTLLNRETYPIFQATFTVPRTSLDNDKTNLISIAVNWPVSEDGYNIQIAGIAFDDYVVRLNDLATEIDDYKSNLVTRFLVAPQLFEFDTEDQKIDKIFQLYGQSFDKVKSYIDNIAYMRHVSYDAIENIPDVFLKNLANTLGLNTINLFDQKTLEEQIYNASSITYEGQSIGKNLVEAELEFYRRLLVNLAYIYKSKGTRSSIEFFLKFIGAPEPMIKIDEYVYEVKSALPPSTLDDINNTINNINVTNTVTFDTATYTYSLSSITGLTTSNQLTDYPVDDKTLLPKTPTTNQDTMFFQKGSGWYNTSLDHRSIDILDTESSVLTGRTKTLLTKAKPYTYGEDFFDIYRTLPGLDYGFNITSKIDNTKGQILDDETQSNLILNRKNIGVFVSAANAINYDIWRKSRELELTFGTNSLEPQTGISFAQYLEETFSSQIKNSNTIRYKKNYIQLEDVYQDYVNKMVASGYTPYDMVSSADFVNQMSPYWSTVLDQIIPSTTLWMGGNLVENNIFGRPKYAYKKPCKPLEIVENLYPNFETVIEEDLETILGDPDNLRGLMEFSGVTFTLHMDIDGVDYEGISQVILTGSTLFGSGFTANESCHVLTSSTTKIPLICEYKNWINLNLNQIKAAWTGATVSLVNQINQTHVQQSVLNKPDYVPNNAVLTGHTQLLSYEFFKDEEGVEKVRFTANSFDECYGKKSLDFYFDIEYKYTNPQCYLDISFETPCDVYTGTSECKLSTDIIVNLTGVTVQSGNDNGWGVYVQRNCTPGNNIYYGYNSTYTDTTFLPVDGTNCQFKISNVREDEVIDLVFTDAANCEKKVKIEGLDLKYVEYPVENPDQPIVVNTGYTITPKVQFRNTYNYGLKHDTKVLVVSGATINASTTPTDIASYITAGTLVKKDVKDLSSGNVILGASYLSCSTFASSIYEQALENNDYSFSYDYNTYTISDIDCLGSIKKSEITGVTKDGTQVVIEVLPTTKLRVYTNKIVNETTGSVVKRDGHFFDSRSPEFLQIKPAEVQEEPCCNYPSNYYETGDFLITEKGELIEVVAVNLNYCESNLYYNINVTGTVPNKLVLFNGNASTTVLIEQTYSRFDDLNINLSQFYQDNQCCTDPIENPTRNYTTECGDIAPAYVCGDQYPVYSPTPTPSPTISPTPSPTATGTPTPTPSSTPQPSPSPTATATNTPLPTATSTPTPTASSTPPPTATGTPTPTPSKTPTPTASATPEPTGTPTPTPTQSPTPTPTPNCDFEVTIGIVTATPTPTPTPTENCEFGVDTNVVTATPTPTPTPTDNCEFGIDTNVVTATPTPTPTPTENCEFGIDTNIVTATPTPTPTPTENCEFIIDTNIVTATPTPTPTPTENCEFVVDTNIVTATPTPTPTPSPTPTATDNCDFSVDTFVLTATPTPTPTPTPSPSPTENCDFVVDANIVTATPTPTPTSTPTPTPTATPNCDFTATVEPYQPIVIDSNTEINIWFDDSGSMNSTLTPLETMRNTILRDCLVQFYNNDYTKYDQNVKVNNFSSKSGAFERTFYVLNTSGSTSEITKVINLVFQDESSPYSADSDSFSSSVRTTQYDSDIAGLRNTLDNAPNSNYYRGIIFRVNTGGYDGFRQFISAVINGTNAYSGTNGLSDKTEITWVESVTAGSNAQYYADTIITALNTLGYNLALCNNT